MAREDLHFRLRLPEPLKEKVAAVAADNHRSMTAEIVARLDQSFLDEPFAPFSREGMAALLKRFEAGVAVLEDTAIAPVRPGLEKFIEAEAAAGNPMSRSGAVLEIVDRYLSENGYAPFRGRGRPAAQHNKKIAKNAPKPKR